MLPNMGGWWVWTKSAIYYIIQISFLLAIYNSVIETRFQSVMFSMVALIYVELVSEYSVWTVELLAERDHRNEIHQT